MTRRSGDDDGAATVTVLALVAVLTVFAGVLASVGSLVVTRHRADAAADLAALAAAQTALQGAAAACGAARRVAEARGGSLVRCELVGDVARVAVEVLPAGRLAGLGPARGEARAGPG